MPEHDRQEDLFVVDLEVVDAGAGDCFGVMRKVDDAGAGHFESAHLLFDREQHSRRIDLEGGVREVAVEEIVPVLVGGHALHDLLAGGVDE